MRSLFILRTLVKYRLAERIPHPLVRVLFRVCFFWQKKAPESLPLGAGLRQAMHDLGPMYIKLGQMLSVRRDLLDDAIADELESLQDQVPPESWEVIRRQIPEEKFRSIEVQPLASASIAQVHRAIDQHGRHCVIKVVRPNISTTIERDIRLAKRLARVLTALSGDVKRLRLAEVIADYERVIHQELDLSREAANMSHVRRNFAGAGILKVPEVYWECSSEQILVMEEVSGISVNDIATLKARQVNFKKLAELGVEIFFTQVFRDNFFHADMHPGNIFINAANPECPSYVAVDFGIMGSLTPEDRFFLAESLLAFFDNDYEKLADVYMNSGWVPSTTRRDELTGAFRTTLEPVAHKPISQISLAKVLMKLFRVSRTFGMEVQPQLVLLDKTLLYIEGLGKQIYPDLDLWQTAKPFLERWMSRHVSARELWRQSMAELPKFLESLPKTPANLNHAIARFAEPEQPKPVSWGASLPTLVLVQGAMIGGVLMLADERFYFAGIFFIIMIALLFRVRKR
jgi:ubiquinone biosynthesis protein